MSEKKRLFICADRSFPHGDAGSNRILFMAKALQENGWKVVVVSTGKIEEKYYDKVRDAYVYQGIQYSNKPMPGNKVKRVFEHNFLLGREFIKILTDEFHVSKTDCILLYTSYLPFAEAIVDFALKKKIGIACDIVEWHQPFQFQGKDKSFLYRKTMYPRYEKFFYRVVPKAKNVIAISNCLKEHFEEAGCKVAVVPIYVDTDNRPAFPEITEKETVDLIYPGNPYKKDDFPSMLGALQGLSSSEKKKVHFHLTGASMSVYKASAPGMEMVLDNLIKEGIICYHSWLEYDELMKLYGTVDFALLPRPIDLTTKANFPSKVPEMMNRGISVIMNRVGDIADYLSDGEDAVLYDGEGTEACLEALKRVMDMSPAKRIEMKRAAYDNAAVKFNYHLCSDTLDSFFTSLVK